MKHYDILSDRYRRQLIMPEIGEEGQKKLSEASVLVIGAGGLGSSVCMYLAAAGTGRIGIADGDRVSLSNLNRQIMHDTGRVNEMKTDSAKKTLSALNPDIDIVTYGFFLNSENISDIISGYDFIIDAADSPAVKFLINDACVRAGKPFVYAGAAGTGGQIMTVMPKKTPCLRCLFGQPTENTGEEIGIIGGVCGIAGSTEAMEAIKYIVGKGGLLAGKILTFDCFSMRFKIINTGERQKNCPVCGDEADV